MTPEEIAAIKKAIDEDNLVFFQQNPHLLKVQLNHNEMIAIHYAAERGRLNQVRIMLNLDKSLINALDRFKQTPIILAAYQGHEDIIKQLVNSGADLTIASQRPNDECNEFSAIHWAAFNNKHKVVEFLIPHYGDRAFMRVGSQSYHLIHIAALSGSVDVVRLLLKHNPKFALVFDSYNQTAVLWAASRNHADIVKLLVDSGSDLKMATNDLSDTHKGYAPVHWAAFGGHEAVMSSFISHGTDLDLRATSDRLHAIHIAAKNGHTKIVEMLIKNNPALVDLQDVNGQPPLVWAAAKGHGGVVKLLCDFKANVRLFSRQRRSFGYNPIFWATLNGHTETAIFLLPFYTDPKDLWPDTLDGHLIHLAAESGCLLLVNKLLEMSPDLINLCDKRLQTPMMCAARRGQAEIVNYFINKDKQAVAKYFHRALEVAQARGHDEVANIIILEMTRGQDKSTILPFMRSGSQVLDMIRQAPSFLSVLIADERIVALVEHANAIVTENSIKWYNIASGKRASCYMHVDREAKTLSVFNPVRDLGAGHYGKVRLLQSDAGQKLRVKSLKQDVEYDEPNQYTEYSKDVADETQFNAEAYPEDIALYYEYAIWSTSQSNQRVYTNRQIASYFEGELAGDFLSKSQCPRLFARVVLRLVEELQKRFHDRNIIHGDIREANILIRMENNEIFVRYIDLGLSYYITSAEAVTFKAKYKNSYICPERFFQHPNLPKPHPNQDIYSLGYMFNEILKVHPVEQLLFMYFPCIEEFISVALKDDPSERPNLKSFHQKLSEQLESYNPVIQINQGRVGRKQSVDESGSSSCFGVFMAVKALFFGGPNKIEHKDACSKSSSHMHSA